MAKSPQITSFFEKFSPPHQSPIPKKSGSILLREKALQEFAHKIPDFNVLSRNRGFVKNGYFRSNSKLSIKSSSLIPATYWHR